jgi:hypothetical protein
VKNLKLRIVVEFMKIVYDEEKLKDIPSKLPKVRNSFL